MTRCISADYTRILIRSHSRRTTQKRAFSNSLAGGSDRIGRVRPRISTSSWQLTPVSGPSFDGTKKKRCPKEEKGARALIACPAFTLWPVFFAMCSRYMEHNTGHAGKLPSCERTVVRKLLLEPYGIGASSFSRKMKAKPHVVITRCTGDCMRVPSRGCNSRDRRATNGYSLSRMRDSKHFSPIDFVINEKRS